MQDSSVDKLSQASLTSLSLFHLTFTPFSLFLSDLLSSCPTPCTMPRLSEILNQVMVNPVVDPGSVLHPIGSEAGAPVQPALDGNPGGIANGGEPESEEALAALQYAETSLDFHGLEGASRDNVRRFSQVCLPLRTMNHSTNNYSCSCS